jgi:uncharacterized repeat protein (TIGR01451 family)
VTTFDVESDAVTVSLTSNQSWLSVSGNLLSGVPPVDAIGSHQVTLSANDGTDSTEQTFTLTVNARTHADLSISVTLSKPAVLVGEDLLLDYLITNDGPADATNIALVFTIAGSAEFIDNASGCDLSDNRMDCPYGTSDPSSAFGVQIMASSPWVNHLAMPTLAQ